MSDNVDALRVIARGKAYVSPLGTTAPIGIDALGPPIVPIPWPVGWIDLGMMSEDGLAEGVDEDRNEWKPWGYNAPVRTQIKSEKVTFKFTCWETNSYVLSLRHRVPYTEFTNPATSPTTEVHFSTKSRTSPDIRAFGFDLFDGANHFRYIVARGEITDRADVEGKEDDPMAYEFTCTAYPGSDGVSIKRMIKAGLVLPT